MSIPALMTDGSPLSPRRTRLLIREIQSNPSADAAMEELVRHNGRLIKHIAAKYVYPPGLFDDVFEEGVMAIIRAARGFDLSRPSKFSVYVYRAIDHAISRYLEKERRAEKDKKAQENQLRRAFDAATAEHPVGEIRDWVDLLRAAETMESLTDRERQILQLVYSLQHQRSRNSFEIAEILGWTPNQARRIVASTKRKLAHSYG